jgi:hypothetical protein
LSTGKAIFLITPRELLVTHPPMHSSSVADREIIVFQGSGRVTAHPSITGWKTAPRASGADVRSGGIECIQHPNGNTSKKERCHEVGGLIVLRSFG